MPAISPNILSQTLALVDRATVTNTSGPLQVICAWPLSGQYGPGTRVLYYVLVATCVLARKTIWLRKACLAAALVFPAVAGVHAIVLAAVNVDGAVDMDVFGAFQLCSIGILAAPITARQSRTYFEDPRRNIIFLWTGLVLAGLLSLAVEFFKIDAKDCTLDDSGAPINFTASDFPYGNTMCHLTCDTTHGPFSPLRKGSTNNIYVIPVPHILTFATGTLLAAACCIPAILTLVSMWIKILKTNGLKSKKMPTGKESVDEKNSDLDAMATKRAENRIGQYLKAVEPLLFVAAVLGILILGELNFFSAQMNYQTEPMASIGQWGPLMMTFFAALGSLSFLKVTRAEGSEGNERPKGIAHHGNYSTREVANDHGHLKPTSTHQEHSIQTMPGNGLSEEQSQDVDRGHRRKVAKVLTAVADYFGTPADGRFDNDFETGRADEYPRIPGEDGRNPGLSDLEVRYNGTSLHRSRSRASSIHSQVPSDPDVGAASSSSQPPTTQTLQRPSPAVTAGPSDERDRPRRNTLAVPLYRPHRTGSSSSSNALNPTNMQRSRTTPTIVLIPDRDTPRPSHEPRLSPQSPVSPTTSIGSPP